MRLRLAAACAAGVLAVLVTAAPAAAHSGETATSTAYHSRLVSVSPSVPGARLELDRHGTHVQVTRSGAREVVVLGYQGEPYLKLTADGVYASATSATSYVNEILDPKTRPAGSAPLWRRIADGPQYRWHDHRTHWIGTALPPAAQADPAHEHRITNWTIGLEVDGRSVTAAGTLDYLPPPQPSLWWAAVLVAAAAVALLGRWPRALGVLLGLAGLAALAEGIGRSLDYGDAGWAILGGLFGRDTYGTLTALGAVAAGVVAVLRRPAGEFALALAGVCLAVLAGVTRADVFAFGGAPVPWNPLFSRLAVGAALAIGAGVTVAAWQRLRAERRATAPAATG
ncbi:MAG: hypothetical protein QOJ50_2022 [Cryptosporangiaceae bacterium]|nr:hypothetical protein [Cryptosporangiaceae bacterium]